MDFTAQLSSEWYAWHDARVADLATPFGWLSLVGIKWVQHGQSLRCWDVPGEFSREGEWMRFRIDEGQTVGLTADAIDALTDNPDSPLVVSQQDNAFTARVSDGQSLHWLVYGHYQVELINRGGYMALRLRDSKAELLQRFIDVPTFPLSESWVTVGHYTPFDSPQRRDIACATPGLDLTEDFPGTLTFALAGAQYRVVASGTVDSGLYINFFDYTSGDTTPAWRRLDVGVPDAHGEVIVDFNRTVLYPFAFTPFATCPAPLPENFLPLAVEAGERKPAQTLKESGINTPILLVRTGGEEFYTQSVEHLRELGIDVTAVDATGGEILPPLTGYAALVVVGYDVAGSGGVTTGVVELMAEAVAASLPVVAIGNAAGALSEIDEPDTDESSIDALSITEPSAHTPTMKSGGFLVGNLDESQNVRTSPVYDVTVSKEIAGDSLFASIVTYDDSGTCYIPVRDLAAKLREESNPSSDSITWSTHTTWQDLIERFARLVHSNF